MPLIRAGDGDIVDEHDASAAKITIDKPAVLFAAEVILPRRIVEQRVVAGQVLIASASTDFQHPQALVRRVLVTSTDERSGEQVRCGGNLATRSRGDQEFVYIRVGTDQVEDCPDEKTCVRCYSGVLPKLHHSVRPEERFLRPRGGID